MTLWYFYLHFSVRMAVRALFIPDVRCLRQQHWSVSLGSGRCVSGWVLCSSTGFCPCVSDRFDHFWDKPTGSFGTIYWLNSAFNYWQTTTLDRQPKIQMIKVVLKTCLARIQPTACVVNDTAICEIPTDGRRGRKWSVSIQPVHITTLQIGVVPGLLTFPQISLIKKVFWQFLLYLPHWVRKHNHDAALPAAFLRKSLDEITESFAIGGQMVTNHNLGGSTVLLQLFNFYYFSLLGNVSDKNYLLSVMSYSECLNMSEIIIRNKQYEPMGRAVLAF